MTERIDKLTQQKATAQQKSKAYECKRIIEVLQHIQDAEQSLKYYLTAYKVGEPTDELKLFYGMPFLDMANSSIRKMNDAMEQLQNSLNDNSLRQQFLDYVGQFNVLPKRILIDNFPQQE